MLFEDLGILGEILPLRGYQVEYIDMPGLSPDNWFGIDDADLIVILGGPMSVNDPADYPWIEKELSLIRRRLANRRPTLGICLGAQFMAKALGARVYPGQKRQIGWGTLEVTDAGAAAGFSSFSSEGKARVLHWHGETFDLPSGAVRLAGDPICPNQAFALDNWGLALQFHLEAAYPALEHWFAGHCAELAQSPKVSISELREQSIQESPAAIDAAGPVFDKWLSGLEA